MDVSSKSETNKNGSTQHVCASCHKTITERFLLKASDLYWHEDCLKCQCCDCRLGEVGSTFYSKANLRLCKRDYLRLFGNTGFCAACNKQIPAFEMVMRARTNVYHLDCFACQQCTHRFCVGDRFYLCENKILCEYDYEERLTFANMGPALQSSSLAYIKRQLPPIPTPPAQNMHPGHNPLQPHQGLGQPVAQNNHVPNESFPLVDFLLAFAALTTLKHLILITAKRPSKHVAPSLTVLRYCVVNFNVRYVPTFSPSFSHLGGESRYLLGFYLWGRSQCSRPIWTAARSNFPIIVGLRGWTKLLPVAMDGPVSVKEAKHSGWPTLYHILSAANIGNRYVPAKLSPACLISDSNDDPPRIYVTCTFAGAIANCPRRKKKGTNERTLVLQSGTSHKSHFTRYILNSVPLPHACTRVCVHAACCTCMEHRTCARARTHLHASQARAIQLHVNNSNPLSCKIELEVISKPASAARACADRSVITYSHARVSARLSSGRDFGPRAEGCQRRAASACVTIGTESGRRRFRVVVSATREAVIRLSLYRGFAASSNIHEPSAFVNERANIAQVSVPVRREFRCDKSTVRTFCLPRPPSPPRYSPPSFRPPTLSAFLMVYASSAFHLLLKKKTILYRHYEKITSMQTRDAYSDIEIVKAGICDTIYDTCADTVFALTPHYSSALLLRSPSGVTFFGNEAHDRVRARRHADILERRLMDPNASGMLACNYAENLDWRTLSCIPIAWTNPIEDAPKARRSETRSSASRVTK
ncbi:Rhombotin-1 [Ooceraea biroi]|uniref:Rhombotin-1 n=1 Tax=Ooceraea biroi TaxID=2015173 RepID=A0A026WD18_OOCBI|nr:Rhombotin-1 [Ooceraea biroi]